MTEPALQTETGDLADGTEDQTDRQSCPDHQLGMTHGARFPFEFDSSSPRARKLPFGTSALCREATRPPTGGPYGWLVTETVGQYSALSGCQPRCRLRLECPRCPGR